MKTYYYHPVAEMFPLIEGEEFEQLVADIQLHGQREPILLAAGRIVDGRNRYRACQALKIDPRTIEWDGRGSLAEVACSLNLRRRHLTPSQRAAAAVGIEHQFSIEAKDRQTSALKKGSSVPEKIPEREKGESREMAAKACGVNPRYVSDAKFIWLHDRKLFSRVVGGSVTLSQARRVVMRDGKKIRLAAQAKAAPPGNGDWEIRNGDCLKEMQELRHGQFRLIFADPPYNQGIDYGGGARADRLGGDVYIRWCRDWIGRCANLLADDGSMWVLIDDAHADYFAFILRENNLHRRAWIKWYETFGVNCANNFNRTSRHLFYCVKDPDHFIFNRAAVTRRSARQEQGDKRADPAGKIWDDVWQIPRLVDNAAERIPEFPTQLPLALVRPIIECASDPGDTVFDPFSGSGTTGHACILSGRKFLGIEKNAKFAEWSRLRLRATGHQNAGSPPAERKKS